MLSFTFITAILLLQATLSFASPLEKRNAEYFPPSAGGGTNLDNAGSGGGEPLNVIISGLSSPPVLTDRGFLNYARALGISNECLGLHQGAPQTANLGDGHGSLNETVELRQDFKNAFLGTCLESLIGGNHLRMWRQNGPNANSGALFLAVSHEQSIAQHHTISRNGYNIGRDLLVNTATSAQRSFGGVTYSTTSRDITGLLPTGSEGINHGIAIDGIVKLLTVTII